MARFKAADVDNYKTGNGGTFFSLANDGDYERVRLMYNDMEDVELFSVHEIEVGGQTYWVNCNREYDEPLDKCPLCEAGNKITVKMWIPLYIENTKEVKVWERGRTFVSKLESAARRFTPLVSNIFEIERNGKKGDQQTTYELIHVERDKTTLDELPEKPEIIGTIVKELTCEQMTEFLETGKLPNDNKSNTQRNPERDRRGRSNSEEQSIPRRQVRTRGTSDDQSETDVF